LWPSEWLYWHTERHCWDRIKGTSGTYDERQPEPPPSSQLQAADVIPAPKQVTTTKEKKLPEPEILYPAVLINKSNILETVPAHREATVAVAAFNSRLAIADRCRSAGVQRMGEEDWAMNETS
jgi:hypothetical protein